MAAFRQAYARQGWDDVIDIYRGDLLASFSLDGVDGFVTWLELERENLRRAYRRALNHSAEELEAAGHHAAAAARLEPLLDTEDLAEEALQAYMRNAYLAGLRQQALDAYERFKGHLADEMELEPAVREMTATAEAQAKEAHAIVWTHGSGSSTASVRACPSCPTRRRSVSSSSTD